jgi:hypothetical protein
VNKPDASLNIDSAVRQMLATLEFVKIVTHLKECPKTGPALSRMVLDPTHGEENIHLLCTALVSLQGLLGQMIAKGNAKEAEEVQPLLLAFMERLGNEHEALSVADAATSVVH